VGATVIGFGLSPLITAPLAKSLIDSFGIKQTFVILGIAFAVIITAISTLLKTPPPRLATRRLDSSYFYTSKY